MIRSSDHLAAPAVGTDANVPPPARRDDPPVAAGAIVRPAAPVDGVGLSPRAAVGLGAAPVMPDDAPGSSGSPAALPPVLGPAGPEASPGLDALPHHPRASGEDQPAGKDAGKGDDAEPRPRSLRERAVKGSVMWVSVYGIMQVVRLGSNFTLMALLTPAMFGVVRLATVVVQGLKMFSEVGIRQSIVRHERGDEPDFLNTAFTMQAGRGVLLWIVATALAWPMAAYYEERMLMWVLPAVAVGALLGGFCSTSVATLNRHLDEGPRARLELFQAVVTRSVMIAWAFYWPSAWALVAGTLVGNLYYLIYSHTRLNGIRNRLHWNRDAAREIWRFGSWVLIGTIIAYFGQQLDSLMLGKLEEMAVLGIYGMALTVSRLPHELTSHITMHVLYPVMSEINRDDPARFAMRVRKIRSTVLHASLFLSLGVIVTAPWFFRLFKMQWWDITWMAPLSAIAGWIMITNGSVNRALLSLGKSRPLAFSGLVRVIVTGLACYGGYLWGGVPGIIIGVAVGALAEHLVDHVVLLRNGINFLTQDVQFSVAFLAVGGLGYVATIEAAAAFGDPTHQILAGAATSTVIILIAGAWTAWKTLPQILNRRRKA